MTTETETYETETESAVGEEPKAPLSRDDLRAAIFGAKAKSALIENFLGNTTIEIRQPSIHDALNMRQGSEDDQVYRMLTEFAYVPETNQKIFEEADVENIKTLPFGDEMQNLMAAINKLLGVNPEEVEKAIKDAEKSA